MKKIYRCHVDLDSFKKTDTGKRKVWFTANVITYCCSCEPCLFIWERSTKYNDYNPYSGYVPVKRVKLLWD